jgi:hypothetical protein
MGEQEGGPRQQSETEEQKAKRSVGGSSGGQWLGHRATGNGQKSMSLSRPLP